MLHFVFDFFDLDVKQTFFVSMFGLLAQHCRNLERNRAMSAVACHRLRALRMGRALLSESTSFERFTKVFFVFPVEIK